MKSILICLFFISFVFMKANAISFSSLFVTGFLSSTPELYYMRTLSLSDENTKGEVSLSQFTGSMTNVNLDFYIGNLKCFTQVAQDGSKIQFQIPNSVNGQTLKIYFYSSSINKGEATVEIKDYTGTSVCCQCSTDISSSNELLLKL